MRSARAVIAGAVLLAPVLLLAQPPAHPEARETAKVIDVRASQPPAGNTFEALWTAWRKAAEKSDAEGAAGVMKEIRRLRTERNIPSLETLALARVALGLDHVKAGNKAEAVEDFKNAVELDPYLPDAHLALAAAQLRNLPLGIPSAIKEVVTALVVRTATVRGTFHLVNLATGAGMLTALVTVFVLGLVMLLRCGPLLLHDLEEAFGAGRRPMALAAAVGLLLLPAWTFQGFAWLPLWWLALLLPYMGAAEKAVSVVFLAATVAVGPALTQMQERLARAENPLYRASLVTVEGGPDSRALADLEQAYRDHPDDRDYAYLLGSQFKKSGRYEEAQGLYRQVLAADGKDTFALNDLANLEFASGEFPAAIAHYKQALESGPGSLAPEEWTRVSATLYYNLSLAQYQKFDYQPAQESRSQADHLASALVRSYDADWKYESGLGAVVDLTLTPEQVARKFADPRPSGIRANVVTQGAPPAPSAALSPASFLNRFSAMPLLAGLLFFGVSKWRGPRAFTTRCQKCGTPFCKLCHLGKTTAGLCSQCHHLFVVRDGVSGPARNQKMLEVQGEEERRDRFFRVLSLLTPGAGHLYAQKTLLGVLFVLIWSAVLSLAVLAGRLLPLTQAPASMSRPWGLSLAGLVLLVLYVVANRAKPEAEVVIVSSRRPAGAARRAGRAS